MTAMSAIYKKLSTRHQLCDSLCITAGSPLERDAVIKEHLWLLIQIQMNVSAQNYQSSLTRYRGVS